ncbi:hypothetical protein DM01DRAFT_1300265, partial [Hesseltinella vesiculosa]
MKLVQSFSEIFSLSTEYSTIACDIYGVIHDGFQPYPFTQSALEQLRQQQHDVILLSNSSRMYPALSSHMATQFNLAAATYRDILSSGKLTRLFLEECAAYLRGHPLPPECFASLRDGTLTASQFCESLLPSGRSTDACKFYVAGNSDYLLPLYDGLQDKLEPCEEWQHDDIGFVLLASVCRLHSEGDFDRYDKDLVSQHYEPFLQACVARDVPLICVNPDVVAPHGEYEDGSARLLVCPGYIGELYEALGGKVLYFGKPFSSIYDYLLRHYGDKDSKAGSDGRRVLCVGDNVATDVLGASQVHQDVVLILSGVHASTLGDCIEDPNILKQRVRILCQEAGTPEPTYLMPYLRY